MGTEEIKKELDTGNWYSELAHDQWVKVPVSGPPPLARYKHAAAVVDEKLYIAGGSRNGRYLSDVQVFDFRNMAWSTLILNRRLNEKREGTGSVEAIPAISDHHLIHWGTKLLLVGGKIKESSDNLAVHFIDLETHHCGVVETSGSVPVCRGGHSATLHGSRLIIFGGEDRNRHLLNDIHTLDLETMVWQVVETTQTPPAPRFDHIAAVHAGCYFLIFCGCSHATFFNDLHVLDFQTMEWSQPQLQCDFITPRAGHSGTTIENNWYIVGGGDNKNGTPETLLLNMSKLACSVLTTVKDRHPLASEGLSVCSVSINCQTHLVAFGGYNGKYSNEVYIMKPKFGGTQPPRIFRSPAAAAAAASVTAAYAIVKPDVMNSTWADDSNSKESENDLTTQISSMRDENKQLESAVSGVRVENAMLEGKVDELNTTYAELSKELRSVEGQLAAERSRCSKLEGQILELQKMLGLLPGVEMEVQQLRSLKSGSEQEVGLAEGGRKSSSGVFRWVYGGQQ